MSINRCQNTALVPEIGTLSAEHGIGVTKKSYLSQFIPDKNIELMKSIKKIFDPNEILNPGKIL